VTGDEGVKEYWQICERIGSSMTAVTGRTAILEAERITMKLSKLFLAGVVMGVAGLLASGCAWSIGDQKDGKTYVQPTKGQELVDLKRAKDAGALTEEEFQAQKNKVLSR
jgi:hypothetical protein